MSPFTKSGDKSKFLKDKCCAPAKKACGGKVMKKGVGGAVPKNGNMMKRGKKC